MDNPEEKTPSPLEGVSIERFKGHTFRQENVVSVPATRVTLIRNDPNRLFWIAINEGAADVRLSTDPNLSATSGWLIPAGGGVISMFWEQDGEGVGYEVFAISVAGANNVRVAEVKVL